MKTWVKKHETKLLAIALSLSLVYIAAFQPKEIIKNYPVVGMDPGVYGVWCFNRSGAKIAVSCFKDLDARISIENEYQAYIDDFRCDGTKVDHKKEFQVRIQKLEKRSKQ